MGQSGASLVDAGYNSDMHRSSTTQVLRAWIALVAFLFSLFAPALSHAFAPPQLSVHTSEICTAAGMVMMPMADGPDEVPGAMPDMMHCDLCCSHHAPVVPPSPADLPLAIVAMESYPRLFYQSPSPQFAWTPAQSRAPPASFS
ncbi:DUF2946 domain-containing protein [Massilia sp. BSC265]|uniref:DUF2946 domain-containing protein n=1 Tax=Massilia sp. BSC265 TaxID=1549812 RepID=UPI0027D8C2C5|nr:DUF2946 domain-containing protein [Massilia sp. BSC265]